jgi:aminopeptidase
MAYTPSSEILQKYADVMVNYALGNGKGIKPGDVVRLVGNEAAKPLYLEMRRAIWKAGGHVIDTYLVDEDDRYNFSRDFFTLANDEQLEFFPAKLLRGMIDEIDHLVFLLSDADPHALEGIDPKKMMRTGAIMKPWMDWRREKESAGKFSWSLCLYGTPLMAKEANLSEEEYWQQIIDACFLEEADPVAKWRAVSGEIQEYVTKLNALHIETLRVEGEDVDLHVKLGPKRAWKSGGGSNIPSFEIFTSPDWRGMNGWIRFNMPLYRYGNLVEGIRLEFKDGVVSSATATKNENVLKEMIATENADKVGEFSLTDRRHSRITKFMAETLFDENTGGPFGNTHIAVGSSYHDCYDGDISKVTNEQWAEMGYNDSSVHTDMFSTTDRTVTATLPDGSTKVIYKDGQFTL